MLIGNKSDEPSNKKEVKYVEANQLANENEVTYYETSARFQKASNLPP